MADQPQLSLIQESGTDTVVLQENKPWKEVKLILPLPGQKDIRVFVGGDYDHLPDLRLITKIVDTAIEPTSSMKFVSIMPFDLLAKEQTKHAGSPSLVEEWKRYIHALDIYLLEQCKYAIFEITSPAGQLMELQHAIIRARTSKDIFVRCLYKNREHTKYGEDTKPDHISSMITTSVKNVVGYTTFEELDGIIPQLLTPNDTLNKDLFRAIIKGI